MMDFNSLKAAIKPGILFIDGKYEDAASGKTLPVMNPATGFNPGGACTAV